MIRKFVLLSTLIALLFISSIALAQEDETSLILPILENGETFVEFLSNDVQSRLYAFNGTAGNVVTISMTQITQALDPFLVLLGPAGEVVASDDDSGELPLSSLIDSVTLLETGTYFVMASSFEFIDDILEFEGESTELEFELSISGFKPSVEDDDSFLYFAGDLFPGIPTEGSSTAEKPVFYFVFEGQAGQSVNISMNSDDFDTILHVFAPGGARIAVNDDFDGTHSAIENLILPENGLYLVFATDVFFYNVGDEDTILDFFGGDFEISMSSK